MSIVPSFYIANPPPEKFLKEQANAKFDRSDFDSLSGKFMSKLVIRAN